jgi:hypothetical protein
LLLSVCLWVLLKSERFWLLNRANRKGFNPAKDKPTMFHVRELILREEKELAIQMYCQIFHVSRSHAKQEVENLERSIKEKNA